MNHRHLSRISILDSFIKDSKSSIVTLSFLISNSSLMQLLFSLNIFKTVLYRNLGSKCMKGICDMILLLQICWCPPKGICHAGNPQKMHPLSLSSDLAFVIKAFFWYGFICSMTSWTKMISNFSDISAVIKSAYINFPPPFVLLF